MPDINTTIRAEIARRELSANQLARDTGLPQTTISAFLRGADMRGSSLSKLLAVLGLEVRAVKRRPVPCPTTGDRAGPHSLIPVGVRE